MTSILYQGNSLDFMATLPDKNVDVIFADPPYGINLEYNSYVDTQENLKALVEAFMPQALRIATRVIITPGVNNVMLYPQPTWILAWVNMAGVGSSRWGFSCWQPILAYGMDPFLQAGKGRRPDTFFQRKNDVDRKDVNHPCPKPITLMNWIVERTSFEGQTVYDPFMGSGTTGIACARLGRNFIGSELDPEYFKVATQLIAEAEAQPRLPTVQKEEPVQAVLY